MKKGGIGMKEAKSHLYIRNMVFTALFAALICVAAPFSIQAGPIPISLATFAIYLTGAILGGKRGMVATAVYILIGAVGLPVFSGFRSGFGTLFGPTGGYIIGYIPLVLITGIFAEMNAKKINRAVITVIGMILATAALYTFGTVWYMIVSGNDLATALKLCALPFIPGDAIKIVCATALSVPLKAKLNNAMFGSDQHKDRL